MKKFEEKWTAWVDGELDEAERAEFEASLDDRSSAEAEKQQALKLGALLKEQLQPRAMGNEEFFNYQLRERIVAESGLAQGEPAKVGGPSADCFGAAQLHSRFLPSAPFSSCGKSRRRINRST